MAERETVSYGGTSIVLHERGDGRIAVRWREDGKWRTTTRLEMEDAKKWARVKARELDTSRGAQWVTPAAREQLEWLRRIAGGAEAVPAWLSHMEAAMGMAQGQAARVAEAVRWFMAQGGGDVRRTTVAEAVRLFLVEYERRHPSITVRGPKSELQAFSRGHGKEWLEAVTPTMLEDHIARGGAGKRTMMNRHAYWTLFFNWAKQNQYWPREAPAPISSVKRKKPDKKAPAIFSPDQGRALLAAVSEQAPQHLAYLVVAGWLGCRPFECQRLLWSDLDEAQGLLHVRADVARKVAAERWVAVCPEVMRVLQGCREAARKRAGKSGHVARLKAQVAVSEIARRLGLQWSIDVLRHSRITYRLQETHDIGRVAEESGNSPSEIRASYKRPIPPEMWEKWMGALEAAVPRDWEAKAGRPWTAAELALLGTAPDAEVGLGTGRPTASVTAKRLELRRGGRAPDHCGGGGNQRAPQ